MAVTRRYSGRARLLVALAFLVLAPVAEAVDRPFSPRFSTNDTGNITIAANTLLTCPLSDGRCAGARAGDPINNNVFNMINVDVDSDPTTANSSTSELTIPTDGEVLFAGLYWGSHSGASDAVRSTARLQVPGAGSYETIGPAGVTLDTSSGQAQRYQAFADVTSQVAAAGAGDYTVGGVATTVGQRDRHGAWALVVAFRSPSEPARNLTVFDGLVTVSAGSPVQSIPVSGFRTPTTGPVRTSLGFVSYEGDRGSDGDGATLNGTPLTDASNPANNFFNSTITRGAGHVTMKDPNYLNQLGFDANLINAPGVLPNGATSAVIRVNTKTPDGETYFPGAVTFATELFAPRIESTKSVENLDNPGGAARPGDTLRYTVAFDNTGGDDARGFTVADTIPAGTTYTPGSLAIDGVAPDPTDAAGDDQAEFDAGANRVTYRIGDGADGVQGGAIPPGGTATVSFDVTVDDLPDGSQVTNQASFEYIAATLGTPLRGDTTEVTTPVSAPDLTIAKSHAPPGDFVAGSNVSFELDVENVGSLAGDGSAVTVSDTLPASAFSSISSAAGPGWTCNVAALTVTCTRTDALGAGASYPPITIATTVADPLVGAVVNTAEVSGGGDTNPQNNTATDQGNGASQADLSVAKLADPATVPSGGQVTYTLEVTNRGPSLAPAVMVDDPLPGGAYTDVSASASQGSCDPTVSCALGDLPAGVTATITISATVTANDTTLVNTATAESATLDPDAGNNTAMGEVVVPNTADLAITKDDDPSDPVHPEAGDPYSYTLTVSNAGPGVATGVLVEDRIPDVLMPDAIVAPGWTCNLPGAGEQLTCTRATLATADGEVTITINGTLAGLSGATVVTNSASVGAETVDPDPANNRGDVSNLVLPAADLDLTKSGPGSLAPGASGTFILRLTNLGPGSADDVTVTDEVPAAFRVVGVDATECSVAGNQVECDFGDDFAAGDSREVRVSVVARKAAAGNDATNAVEVTSSTPDPVPASNADELTTRIRASGGRPRLVVAKRASKHRARPGEVLAFRIKVRNRGSAEADSVKVCDRLPDGLGLLRAKGANARGDRACWKLPLLAAGDAETFRLTAQVEDGADPGGARNVAKAKGANAPRAKDAAVVRIRSAPGGPCPGARAAIARC